MWGGKKLLYSPTSIGSGNVYVENGGTKTVENIENYDCILFASRPYSGHTDNQISVLLPSKIVAGTNASFTSLYPDIWVGAFNSYFGRRHINFTNATTLVIGITQDFSSGESMSGAPERCYPVWVYGIKY